MNMMIVSVIFFAGLFFTSVGVGANAGFEHGFVTVGVGTMVYAFFAFLYHVTRG